MRGYLETLLMPELALDDATRARYLQVISDETARLERIVGDLLEVGRLGGGGALAVTDVAVEQLFLRVRARHERALEEAGVTLQTTIEPGAGRVRGDGSRLEQALQNLAANALRYAPRGTVVTLGARLVGDGLALTVSDEGPGIPDEHLPHLFDRFYKAEPSRTVEGRPAGGSGLGLSIVKAIVERHGATISVSSRPGRTVFEIAGLPRAE
jgi:two-component system sensor histidine kinase BaeS